MKSVVLNVRVPLSMRAKLEKDAECNDLTLSDFIREILSNYYEEETASDTIGLFTNILTSIFNSSDFIFLITWMLEKRNNPFDTNNITIFHYLKDIVFRIIKSDQFESDLKKEFEKVFVDLSRFINEYGFVNNHFRFCLANYPESFDYNLLINFIYKKSFEDKI